MNSQPDRRLFYSFLSHAHANKEVVDHLYNWMDRVAEIPVWYDSYNLPPTAKIATALSKAISQCRSMMVVLSKASIQSGWVEDEYSAAIIQRNKNNQFRILPVLIEKCEIPSFLPNTKYIDMIGGELSLRSACEIIAGLYYDDKALLLGNTRDVFVSRSWRQEETGYLLADYLCHLLDEAGFRLVGDSEDQRDYDRERVRKLLTSCGGLVAIVPDRGQGNTSKYIFLEIEMAQNLGLPCLVVSEPAVDLPESIASSAIRLSVDEIKAGGITNTPLQRRINDLNDEWKRPIQETYIFYATDLDSSYKARNQVIKQAIQNITAVECKIGDEIRSSTVRETIAKQISQATLVIADITGDNINSCIEAGMAVGANRPLVLIGNGVRHQPPFMLGNYQMYSYDNNLEMLGIIHKLVFPFRRRIINSEVASRSIS
ncbi:MAG: toll/interleukin-1 receptor domain-containing protein [Ktedonobacteraceae bacterium]